MIGEWDLSWLIWELIKEFFIFREISEFFRVFRLFEIFCDLGMLQQGEGADGLELVERYWLRSGLEYGKEGKGCNFIRI